MSLERKPPKDGVPQHAALKHTDLHTRRQKELEEIKDINRYFTPLCHGTDYFSADSIDLQGLKPQPEQQWEESDLESFPNRTYFGSIEHGAHKCMTAMENASQGACAVDWFEGVFYIWEEIPEAYAGFLVADEDSMTDSALASLYETSSFAVKFPIKQAYHPDGRAFSFVDGARIWETYNEDSEHYDYELQLMPRKIAKHTEWTEEEIERLLREISPIAKRSGYRVMIDFHNEHDLDIALISLRENASSINLWEYLQNQGWILADPPPSIRPDHKFTPKEFFHFAKHFYDHMPRDWKSFIKQRARIGSVRASEDLELFEDLPQSRIDEIDHIAKQVKRRKARRHPKPRTWHQRRFY
jgi:hypothetical protein